MRCRLDCCVSAFAQPRTRDEGTRGSDSTSQPGADPAAFFIFLKKNRRIWRKTDERGPVEHPFLRVEGVAWGSPRSTAFVPSRLTSRFSINWRGVRERSFWVVEEEANGMGIAWRIVRGGRTSIRLQCYRGCLQQTAHPVANSVFWSMKLH